MRCSPAASSARLIVNFRTSLADVQALPEIVVRAGRTGCSLRTAKMRGWKPGLRLQAATAAGLAERLGRAVRRSSSAAGNSERPMVAGVVCELGRIRGGGGRAEIRTTPEVVMLDAARGIKPATYLSPYDM
jgi:hypothetical protein